MTKKCIAHAIQAETGCSSATAEKTARSVIDAMAKTIKDEKTLTLANFGRFRALTTKPRIAQNPRTLEKIRVPSQTIVRFQSSPGFKRILNSPDDQAGTAEAPAVETKEENPVKKPTPSAKAKPEPAKARSRKKAVTPAAETETKMPAKKGRGKSRKTPVEASP